MEFCEKCGSMMKPKKEEDGVYIICVSCGKKAKLERTDDYTIVQEVKHSPKEKLEVTEIKKRRALTDEEREELEDSYGDMLEQMDVD